MDAFYARYNIKSHRSAGKRSRWAAGTARIKFVADPEGPEDAWAAGCWRSPRR
jgi:hypothetical protein